MTSSTTKTRCRGIPFGSDRFFQKQRADVGRYRQLTWQCPPAGIGSSGPSTRCLCLSSNRLNQREGRGGRRKAGEPEVRRRKQDLVLLQRALPGSQHRQHRQIDLGGIGRRVEVWQDDLDQHYPTTRLDSAPAVAQDRNALVIFPVV